MERHFKNTLKASTATRYDKEGARMLTINMPVNNVKKMYQSFQKNNLEGFLGSDDFESDDLGYKFLVHKSDIIPVKIISK